MTSQPFPASSGPVIPELRSILLVDMDPEFLGKLQKDPNFDRLRPVLAGTGADAVADLSKPEVRYRAIFVSTNVRLPGAIPLVKLAHARHPATPVFMIYENEAPLSAQETARLAVHGCVAKPAREANPDPRGFLVELIRAITPAAAVEGGVLDTAPASDARLEPDETFLPVAIEEFLGGLPSFYDVYIRVPSGKFLKLLNAKDTLDPARTRHFMGLGVRVLFIRRWSHERLLSYCDLLASALIRRTSGVSVDLKFGQLASIGAEFAELRATTPLGDAQLDFALEFLADLFALVKQLEKQPRSLVRNFVQSGALMEDGVATAMIAGLLALPLGLDSGRIFSQLGLAALLHDIGLLGLPERVRKTPPLLLPEKDRELYETHPEAGAKMLGKSRRVGPVALQAVAQHHERRDATGFPRRKMAGEIHPFAEIIGIADEFLNLMKQKRQYRELDILATMEHEIFRKFSPKIGEAFRVVFMTPPTSAAPTPSGGPAPAAGGGGSTAGDSTDSSPGELTGSLNPRRARATVVRPV